MTAFLALPSLGIEALGSRQVWSFDKECQFSALGTPYVLKEGERNYCPEEGDGTQETHSTTVYTCEVRQILVGSTGRTSWRRDHF